LCWLADESWRARLERSPLARPLGEPELDRLTALRQLEGLRAWLFRTATREAYRMRKLRGDEVTWTRPSFPSKL
jgi:hypothetical protein